MTMAGFSGLLRPALALLSGLALLVPVTARAAAPAPDPSPAVAPQPDPFPSPTPARSHAAAPPVVHHVVTVVMPVPVAVAARPAARSKPAAPRPRPHARHRRHAVAPRTTPRVTTPPMRIPDHPPPAFVATPALGPARHRVPLVLVVALMLLTLASATLVRAVAREPAT
jgi:hypothetical protein